MGREIKKLELVEILWACSTIWEASVSNLSFFGNPTFTLVPLPFPRNNKPLTEGTIKPSLKLWEGKNKKGKLILTQSFEQLLEVVAAPHFPGAFKAGHCSPPLPCRPLILEALSPLSACLPGSGSGSDSLHPPSIPPSLTASLLHSLTPPHITLITHTHTHS